MRDMELTYDEEIGMSDNIVCKSGVCHVELTDQNDNVNHPAHYTQGKIECIDYIEDKLGKEGFLAYMQGNIIKYITRYKHKNGIEDLKKAKWYLDKMIKTLEKNE
jgi:hypothetical protein